MWFVGVTGWVTEICTRMSTTKITELVPKYKRNQKRTNKKVNILVPFSSRGA